MGRRCDCHGLMEMVRRDPRLRLVPLAAQMLWLRLADALAAMPEPGVFRLGSRMGSVKEIAMLVSCTETEAQTHVETLRETGLLEEMADGALAVPMPAQAGRRAAAAQGNGRLGGRPRRGETAEEARLRRQQGHMVLPIAGGRAETQETQQKPEPEPPLAGAAAAAETEEKQQSREVSDTLVLGEQLAALAGMDPARGVYDFRPLIAWRGRGIPDQMMRDVVAAVAARPNYRAPRTFGYFEQAIAEAFALASPAQPASTAREAAFARHNAEVEDWERGGRAGPRPELPMLGAA